MAEEFIISEDVLVSVQETFLDGVKCIKLNFKNNPPKFQEVDFADAEDTIFKKAKGFVGKSVRVIGWDQETNSKIQFNGNRVKDIVEVVHLIDKSSCLICGKSDNLLNYSEDFGNSWMHYRCKFPD